MLLRPDVSLNCWIGRFKMIAMTYRDWIFFKILYLRNCLCRFTCCFRRLSTSPYFFGDWAWSFSRSPYDWNFDSFQENLRSDWAYHDFAALLKDFPEDLFPYRNQAHNFDCRWFLTSAWFPQWSFPVNSWIIRVHAINRESSGSNKRFLVKVRLLFVSKIEVGPFEVALNEWSGVGPTYLLRQFRPSRACSLEVICWNWLIAIFPLLASCVLSIGFCTLSISQICC